MTIHKIHSLVYVIAILITTLLTLGIPSPECAQSPFGLHQAIVDKDGYSNNGYDDALQTQIGWTRPGLYAFWHLVQVSLDNPIYDFRSLDDSYLGVPQSMSIIANIAPNDSTFSSWTEPNSWMPVDETAYANFVSAVVERYDGDGVDDADGLIIPIKYWQVANEPGLPKFYREDYDKLLSITYNAIKSACSSCKVIIGGVSGDPYGYVNIYETYYEPILKKLTEKDFDMLDVHWYGNAKGDYKLRDSQTGEDVVNIIRNSLSNLGFLKNTQFIITEMGSYSGTPTDTMYTLQTERQQAADYVKRIITAASHGFENVLLAWGLMEGLYNDDGYYDHTGLIYDGLGSNDLGLGVKKLSFYALQNINTIFSGIDMSSVQPVTGSPLPEAIKAYTMNVDGKTVYIVWWDDYLETNRTTRTITLTGLENGSFKIVHCVPDVDTGQEVTSTSLLPTTISTVTDGTLEVVLKPQDPIVFSGPVSLKTSLFLFPIINLLFDENNSK